MIYSLSFLFSNLLNFKYKFIGMDQASGLITKASVKINRLNFDNRRHSCGDPQRVNNKEIIFFTLSNYRDSGMVNQSYVLNLTKAVR